MTEPIKTFDLAERVKKFNTLELPGQPLGMHMGTSYLVNDLWREVQRLTAALEPVANANRPTGLQQTIDEVSAELARATAKFPTWPNDPLHALAVVGEELGELTQEVVQMTYEPNKSSLDAVRKEAIQTAAMGLRFLASIDRYDWTPGDQHSQEFS